MAEYTVLATKVLIVTGSNPRTGIDRTTPYSRGATLRIDDSEVADRLLKAKAIAPVDSPEAEQAEANPVDPGSAIKPLSAELKAVLDKQAAGETLTAKEQLIAEAHELSLDTEGTADELKARIAAEKALQGNEDGE